MFKLLRFLKGLRFKAILAPLFKLLEAILELIVPLCVASLIDKGIGGGSLSYIAKMALIMIALGLVGLLSSITAQYFSAKVATEFSKRMRSSLFAHIMGLASIDRDKLGTSTLITRLTADSNQVQSCINMFLRLFLRSPFVVVGAAIMALIVKPSLSWIFFVVIPILSLIVYLIMYKTIPMYKTVQQNVDQVVLSTRENLYGVRVIRAFCKEEEEINEYNNNLEKLCLEQIRSGKISALLNPLTQVFVNLAVVLIVYVGYQKYKMNLIEVGTIVALVNYMNQILLELVKFANLIVTVTRGIASGNRIEKIFEIESSIKEKEGAKCGNFDSENSVEFESVDLVYLEGGDSALSGINFKIKNGQKLGIIGGTGSGKSSIVNLIPRFYDVTKGSVKVFGLDVRDWDLKKLRSIIGIVPQKARVFKGTIRDNVKWGNEDATDEEVLDALKKAEAYEFVEKKEGKLDFLVEQGGRNLSGGQKQRLTIARALVRKPKILILDDSASALDYATDAKLRHMISKLEGVTTIVVSQRTSSLLSMDNIIVLDGGKINGYGNKDQLLKDNNLYKEIHLSQFSEEKDD